MRAEAASGNFIPVSLAHGKMPGSSWSLIFVELISIPPMFTVSVYLGNNTEFGVRKTKGVEGRQNSKTLSIMQTLYNLHVHRNLT